MGCPLHNGGVGVGHGSLVEGLVGALPACLGPRVVEVPRAVERCDHVSLRACLEHGRNGSVVASAAEQEVGISDACELSECLGIYLRAVHEVF